ncbi:MAG: DNA alkylation response protein, partial [Solirubrobacterales bacterium]
MAETHEVLNQPPPLADLDLFSTDGPLSEALDREGAGWARERAVEFGRLCGSSEVLELGAEANRFTPELKSHDRYGNRVDEVEFHPSWHRLMEIGVENGLHSLPWTDPGPGANGARAPLISMLAPAEAGVGGPISMTSSVVPALRHQPELAEVWEPRVLSDGYDGHLLPADRKPGALAGMAMTEK